MLSRCPQVYIDTSVIGGCLDVEFDVWSNRLLEDCRRGLLHPVVSEVVAVEISRAPSEVVAIYERFLASDPTVLAVTEETLQLADTYCERGIVPEDFRNDALHIAIATVAETDILVSWNFQHIVR